MQYWINKTKFLPPGPPDFNVKYTFEFAWPSLKSLTIFLLRAKQIRMLYHSLYLSFLHGFSVKLLIQLRNGVNIGFTGSAYLFMSG